MASDFIYRIIDFFEWIRKGAWFGDGSIANKLGSSVNDIMQEMSNLLMHTPEISSIAGVSQVFNIIRAISWSCIGLILIYIGCKNAFSPDDTIIKRTNTKLMFTRIVYSAIFSSFSLQFIDILIKFNNMLAQTLVANYKIVFIAPGILSGIFGTLLTIVMMLGQIYFCIKIMMTYWIRIAEITFMGVSSPVMYTLWINPNWTGHLAQWNRRICTLIFTQVTQALLMVLYSVLINSLSFSGTISGICLSLGMLFLMTSSPRLTQQFMDSPDSGIRIMSNTFRDVKRGKTKAQKLWNSLKPSQK